MRKLFLLILLVCATIKAAESTYLDKLYSQQDSLLAIKDPQNAEVKNQLSLLKTEIAKEEKKFDQETKESPVKYNEYNEPIPITTPAQNSGYHLKAAGWLLLGSSALGISASIALSSTEEIQPAKTMFILGGLMFLVVPIQLILAGDDLQTTTEIKK